MILTDSGSDSDADSDKPESHDFAESAESLNHLWSCFTDSDDSAQQTILCSLYHCTDFGYSGLYNHTI